MRISKDKYYLEIAKTVAFRGTCLRRNFGAIIVKNDIIIATGYTGAPRGSKNCCEIGECPRTKAGIGPGEKYELCRSVHAEMNAIICCSKTEMIDSTMYIVGIDAETNKKIYFGEPCKICKRLIINSGINEVKVYEGKNKIKIIPVENFIINEELDLINIKAGY